MGTPRFTKSMIYFDNNATTRVAPDVIEKMNAVLADGYGNPSSIHSPGRAAAQIIDEARSSVAALIGAASPGEIVFTSGGTESDNWALLGSLKTGPGSGHIVTTRVEHEAVRNVCLRLESEGHSVTWLEVGEDGGLDLATLENALDERTSVVSVMLANNETGVLFPVAEIGRIVKARSNAIFHVDGVNAVGKVPIDLKETEIDLFSLSGHKFHGPKGIGALYIRKGINLASFLAGGGQEGGRRAGTEAVHQIAGLGAAADFVTDTTSMERVRTMRKHLETAIMERVPKTRLNGTADEGARLPNTANISFAGTNGEMILVRLNDAGICVSTGSACNAADHSASPVLQAMNIPYLWAMGSIRFSLGRFNTDEEIDRVIEVLPGIVSSLRDLSGDGPNIS